MIEILRRLVAFGKSSDVVFRPARNIRPMNNGYDPDSFTVFLCPHQEHVKLCCVLAHELGHHISEVKLTVRDSFLLSFGVATPKVQREEVLAWDNAFPILQLAGFDDWQVYKAERRRCLATYGVSE